MTKAADEAVTRVFRIRGMDCAEEVAVLKDVVGPLVGGPGRLIFSVGPLGHRT